MSPAAPRSQSTIGSEAELLTLLETLYNSRNPTRRWLHCTRRDWIRTKIEQSARERPGRALETGFGAGVYLPTLADCYREVIAADLDEAHIEHAQPLLERYPHLQLVTDNITQSRLPGASFDLILCSEVLEHIPDTQRVIGEIRRLLAPGGILIISTPQRHSLLELACKVAFLPGIVQVVRRIYREAVFETGHINLLTADELSATLQAYGFHLREHYKSGMYIPLLAEFGGTVGLGLERWLEKQLRVGPLSFLLWTQYYVAQI